MNFTQDKGDKDSIDHKNIPDNLSLAKSMEDQHSQIALIRGPGIPAGPTII